ncbi:MAG: arginyltransferase [Planctomycetes bacterium]|nr:arginyltransferase [Planctomycetota bacterium]
MNETFGKRLPSSLPVLNVLDNEHPCSYLPDRTATMPLIYPGRLVEEAEFDHMLDHGLRRSGRFAYFTACQNCQQCEPTRLDVTRFRWTDSWRRIVNRGDRLVEVRIDKPTIDGNRLSLFNLHRNSRELGAGDQDYTEYDYEGFLIDSCCSSSYELSFWREEKLIAVSIIDCGEQSISAVYTYFDPEQSKLSLGSYSVLKQIQIAEKSERRFVYLGMYVAGNRHLSYKSRFLPQQRYIDGHWVDFNDRLDAPREPS